MLACDERFGSNELAERGDCPAGKPRGRDAGAVQDSEAAHLNSPKRALESQISMSHLVPLLEFNQGLELFLFSDHRLLLSVGVV